MPSQERDVTQAEGTPYRVDIGNHRADEAGNPEATGSALGQCSSSNGQGRQRMSDR